MAYILGIDTGGTYTDGVIYDEENRLVLSKGKALTTHENLHLGIADCLETLDSSLFPSLCQVNLSTTLATNAIVEGQGRPIALFLLGGRPEGKLPAEILKEIPGSFDIRGRQVTPLDEEAVAEAARLIKGRVEAVAISGFASIRNNRHETAARHIVKRMTGLPVVCAHELSSDLGYYDRTVTTALNARLLPVIFELLTAVKAVLAEKGLTLPLMVVTGNGSLVAEQVALERPIETVLSGPAASISGAMVLSGCQNGLILDMGGTTTDIAQVKNGRVKQNRQGAHVGGYHLHVSAARIHTCGLGGDSRIFLDGENRLQIGPQRVCPVCRAAAGVQKQRDIHTQTAFTPTDLLHAEGRLLQWNTQASIAAMKELAGAARISPEQFPGHLRTLIEKKLAQSLADCGEGQTEAMEIVAVGAPSHMWVPGAARLLHCSARFPKHREVANAIGAAAATVSQSAAALIRYNSVLGNYMVFLPHGRREADSLEAARDTARTELEGYVSRRASASGCGRTKLFVTEECLKTEEAFVEYKIQVTAEGKPDWLEEEDGSQGSR